MATNKTYDTTRPLHDFPGGAANSAGMIESATAGCVGGWRSYTGNSATTGSSYGGRFQHYILGAGGSAAALRAYGLVKGVSAEALYGLECTAEIMSTASSAVASALFAGRFVLDINLDCSTTQVAVLDLELDVATSKTLSTATSAFIKFDATGSGTSTATNVFYFADAAGSKSDTALVTTRTADCTSDYAVKCNVAGTTFWLMGTSDTPAN